MGRKKKIHIALTEETHRRLRVKAALKNTTMQDFVEQTIMSATQDVRSLIRAAKGKKGGVP